ncbi:uncharacterized protein LOC135930057 [Gordionus sp. m RMFG-2023]|uniref:uncharacterized protein LOC135930057 n=1 Tax=Gordionus sp. m RMFG-2023 TaxID=3053472 RepID=UPI0031FBE14A
MNLRDPYPLSSDFQIELSEKQSPPTVLLSPPETHNNEYVKSPFNLGISYNRFSSYPPRISNAYPNTRYRYSAPNPSPNSVQTDFYSTSHSQYLPPFPSDNSLNLLSQTQNIQSLKNVEPSNIIDIRSNSIVNTDNKNRQSYGNKKLDSDPIIKSESVYHKSNGHDSQKEQNVQEKFDIKNSQTKVRVKSLQANCNQDNFDIWLIFTGGLFSGKVHLDDPNCTERINQQQEVKISFPIHYCGTAGFRNALNPKRMKVVSNIHLQYDEGTKATYIVNCQFFNSNVTSIPKT